MQPSAFNFAKLPFWRFTFAIAFAFCFVRVSSTSNETDKSALLAFKAGITEDPLGVLSSWNNTVKLCQWYGVTCSRRHQNRVTVLKLTSHQLSGSISPRIGNLSFLKELWLYNNSFHHEIPPQIGRLHRLRSLYLTNNSLTGEIPKNISGCLNLLVLGFDGNHLSGEVPAEISTLVKLRFIYLGKNNLTGSVPSSIGNLSSLEDLLLFENYLGGSLPQALGQLTKLTRLDLAENRLSGMIPPSLYNLSSLTAFDVTINQLHGSLPATMGIGLPNLRYFSIHDNRFVGSIPKLLPRNATSIQILYLGFNKLTGIVPSFESLRNLQILDIVSNQLGSGGSGDLGFLCSLTNITSLTFLNIGDNRLGGPLPEYIGNLSITLTKLILGRNPIVGEIPRAIGNLVNLEILDITETFLSGAIPSEMGNLQNLQFLALAKNNLSGTVPSEMGNLQNLQFLALAENNLSGTVSSFMQNMKKLSVLFLYGNHFNGSIPSHLDNCEMLNLLDLSDNNFSGPIFPLVKSLIILNLSHNHLNGPLSAEVGQIERLTTLDISGNMFNGEIPSTLGNCDGLISLGMKDNHFQGSIPQSISSLRGVEVLDLSNNNLSGEIPKFLETFHFLEILNLSYNNFEGMLPTEGVFKNASATFIIGNNKICGGIPEFRLPKCISRHSRSKGFVSKLKLMLSIISGLLGVVPILIFVYVCWLKKKKAQEPVSSSIDDTWQNLSYGTLLKATNGFSSSNLIGVGSFGSVYRGMLQENETNIAVKVFNLTHHGAMKSFKVECEALKRIKHRNLLKVLTVCSSTDYEGNDFKALVYEFMVNGSLEEWLHPSPVLSNADEHSKSLSLIQRIKISIDIVFALDYLHTQCHSTIVHCDLKPSNILLDAEMVGHVGDFGLAKIILESTSYMSSNTSSANLRGTIGYAAPEYGMGSVVSVEGDVYSYGILLLEMFTGMRPTAGIFKENLSLHIFVEEALPKQVLEITDPILVQEVASYAAEIRRSIVHNCLLMIYKIGISCSVGVPSERMSITDVASQLRSIRDRLDVVGLQG